MSAIAITCVTHLMVFIRIYKIIIFRSIMIYNHKIIHAAEDHRQYEQENPYVHNY